MRDYKIGMGIDYHQMIEGRKLVLGGVVVPSNRGLLGHSDADVILHALSDAMLGALALGDIGQHFPNHDERWRDMDSMLILTHCQKLIFKEGYSVCNTDIMVSLESPKIGHYIPAMRNCIAETLAVATNCVSIKATTTEGMGVIGKNEGASAHAVVLLKPI